MEGIDKKGIKKPMLITVLGDGQSIRHQQKKFFCNFYKKEVGRPPLAGHPPLLWLIQYL
jgi:hypothetical protein